MSVHYPDFYRVKMGRAAGVKLAAEADASAHLALWTRIKASAARDPEGPLVGLAKIAIELWFDHGFSSGEKTACAYADREQFAASFAAARVVDDALAKMAAAGELSDAEHAKLAALNAEAALHDLDALTKTSGVAQGLMGLLKNNPRILGAVGGAALGAGIGAYKDDENRTRGAIMGAIPGATIGATLGGEAAGTRSRQGRAAHEAEHGAARAHFGVKHAAMPGMPGGPAPQGPSMSGTPPGGGPPGGAPPSGQDPSMSGGAPPSGPPGQDPSMGGGAPPGQDPAMGGGAPMGGGDQMQATDMQSAQQAQEQAQKDMLKHQGNVDVLMHVAQTTNNPGLARELAQRQEELLQHLAAGNTALPAWAQRHFPTAEHARHFAEVVRKRTTPMFGGAGGKK